MGTNPHAEHAGTGVEAGTHPRSPQKLFQPGTGTFRTSPHNIPSSQLSLQQSVDQPEDTQFPGLIRKLIKPGQQVQSNDGSYTELEEDLSEHMVHDWKTHPGPKVQ